MSTIDDLFALIKILRTRCPWDIKQTPLSMCTYLLNETYELIDAIENKNSIPDIKEELGDVIFQLFFIASLYEEKGIFSFAEALTEVKEKMVRRHPHIFTDRKINDLEELYVVWDDIKQKEKPGKILDDIPINLPALLKAQKTGKKHSKAYPETSYGNLENLDVLYKKTLTTESPEAYGEFLMALALWGVDKGLEAESLLRQAIDRFQKEAPQ